MENVITCGIDVTKTTGSDLLVETIMDAFVTRELTIRQAVDILDVVKERLSNVIIREVPPAVEGVVKNGRIHNPKELRLV